VESGTDVIEKTCFKLFCSVNTKSTALFSKT